MNEKAIWEYLKTLETDADTGNLAFDTSAESGDDYELTQILTSLGWLNDVIV